MDDMDKRKESERFTLEERERIKEALFRMFMENRVGIVDECQGEIKAFQIRWYVLDKAGVKC